MRARSFATTLLWLLAAAFAGATVWFLVGDLPDRLSVGDRSGLIAAFTGIIALTVSVAAWRWPRTEHSRRVQLEAAHENLTQQVRQQWNSEATGRKLHQTDPIRIQLSPSKRSTAASHARLVGQRNPNLVSSTTVTKLAAAWRHSPKQRWVIIGKPGSGKTTALVILLQEILTPDSKPDVPVPVLFNLADWDPEQTDLTTWLSRQLAHNYTLGPSPRNLATRLVQAHKIIPFLDGLDEMPEPLRAAALDRLAAQDPRLPLVFTSRSNEYETAVTKRGVVLKDTVVAELQDVERNEAIEYLRANMVDPDKWNPIADKLDANPKGALASVLSSPLMIYLLREGYKDDRADLTEFLRLRGRKKIEAHLLAKYVPTTYSTGPGSPATALKCTSEDAVGWLEFLASTMSRNNWNDFAWWRLRRSVTMPRGRLAYVHTATAMFFTGAVAYGVLELQNLAYPDFYESFVRTSPWRYGLLVGTCTGFLILVLGALRSDSAPYRFRFGKAFIVFTSGIIATVTTVMLGMFSPDDMVMVIAMVLTVVSAGLVMANTGSLVEFVSPRATVKQTWLTGTAIGLAGCYVTSTLFAFTQDGSWSRYPLYAATTIPLGIMVMLAFAQAASRFLMVRLYLKVTGKLPFRLIPFLDDACSRGVLRRVGPVYQFRHVKLQEHLAESHRRREDEDLVAYR